MRRPYLLAAAAPVAAAGLVAAAAASTAATLPQVNTSALSTTLRSLATTRTGSTAATTTKRTTGSDTPGTLSGGSSAQVISIPPLQTCVSCTSAQAGSGQANGSATALEVFGSNLEGGSSQGNGNNSGALLAVPANPLLTAALLDWASSSSTSSGHSTSTSRAAVADVALAGGQVATVTVLEGDSTASWTGSPTSTTATGRSATNGAEVNVGQGALVLVLLHSDADSSGNGNAYVASVNNNQILSSGQTGGIPITIPGVGTITLLAVNASGGTTTSTVGSVDNLLNQPGNQATALGTSGSGGTVSGGVQGIHTQTPPNNTSRNQPNAAATGRVGVPLTGAGLGLATGLGLLAAGASALGAGALLRRRWDDDTAG